MSYRQSEVESIYDAARQIREPEKRAAYLWETCAERNTLRHRVEELLDAAGQLGDFMEQDAAATMDLTSDQPIAEGPGAMIGPYKLIEEIGEGGFGRVFVAVQHEPIHRRVALKLIKPGMDSREVIARFGAERQALALMDHPNIARVLDAGTTDSGRPYFVMELIRGVPLTDYCDEAQLTPRARLDLFADLCRAVQHAHQKGIIHRDIKPSNVMVTLHDGRPVVKIIDFGVAKALDRQLSQHSIYTRFHQMIGTPMYMSPEQTGMSSLDVDTRSDIYSLGVLLYELLTGSTPFERERLARGALEEIQRIIREEEPPKPSTRLSELGDRLASIAAVRQTEPARLAKLIRGDLDWIVMKCLEKDRARRYDTALGLAHDIERYLDDEPVKASPPSLIYLWSKFARKYRVALITLAAFIAVLLAGATMATWQAMRATRSERLAAESAQRTERVLEFLISAFRKPDPSMEGPEVKVADVLEQAMRAARTKLVDDPVERALLLHALAQSFYGLGMYEQSSATAEQAFSLYREIHGEGHPVTLSIMKTLADAFSALGNFEKSLKLYERNLELSRASLGDDHPDTLQRTTDLADRYQQAGQPARAIPLLEKALDLTRAELGSDHATKLVSMFHLANCYRANGQPNKAIPLLEEALEIASDVLGTNDCTTLAIKGGLALGYSVCGDVEKAVSLHEQTLEGVRIAFGNDHPQTLTSLGNLAVGYMAAGKPDQALPVYEEALAGMREKLGDDHPNTLLIMGNLAVAYQMAGHPLKSIPLYEENLKLKRNTLGHDHPDTLITLGNLATCLHEAGELEKGLSLLEESTALKRNKLGDDHPDVLVDMGNLAVGYMECQQPEKARPLFEQTLERQRAKVGPDNPYALKTMGNLALCYLKLGEKSRAVSLLEENLELTRAKLGPTHPDTLVTLGDLGYCYRVTGQLGKALRLLQEVLELQKIHLSEDHPATLTTMARLADCHRDAGEPKIALHQETLARMQTKLGDDHQLTIGARLGLADAYRLAGDLEKALQMFEVTVELQRATRGEDHPATLAISRGLARIYVESNQKDAALALLAHNLSRERERLPENHPRFADVLSDIAGMLLQAEDLEEAEHCLLECLKIRQEKQPDNWRLFQTKSMLGEALAGQEQFSAAEPLLLEGFDGMQAKAQSVVRPLPKDREAAVKRLIDFYTRTRQPEKVAKWRAKLERTKGEIQRLRESVSGAPVDTGEADNGTT